MVWFLVLAGVLAEGVAWWLVASGRATVWTAVTPALVVLGASALLAGPPAFAERVDAALAVAVGAAAGVAFYVATRVFVGLIRGWSTFQRDARTMYERQRPLSTGAALLVSGLLAAPSEELFWRGWVQQELEATLGTAAAGAAVALAAFFVANLPSANRSIAVGAAVSGALWVALAAWAGGVAAALVCHAVWTGMMIALPVVEPRVDVAR